MAASRPFEGDFTADPAGVHLFDTHSETVFTAFPESKPQPRLRSQRMSTCKVAIQVFKVLFIVISIAVWCLVLRQFLEPMEPTSQSTNSELKGTPTESSIVPTKTQDIDDSYCPGTDWIAYKDEECFKLIKKWATREEAASICQQERLSTETKDPHLASIKDADEQAFLSKLLFTDSELNVWIGAWRNVSNGSFFWQDGLLVTYSNWASSGSAVDLSVEKNCVEMHKTVQGGQGEPSLDGKWRLAACQQANYFVCQKPQRWPLEKLQRAFLASRREIMSQVVPIGFIYVQLHSQSNPIELWPQFGWLEVSGNYSGTFLRVEGGAAASFGQIQEENAGGQIKSAEYTDGDMATSFYMRKHMIDKYKGCSIIRSTSIEEKERSISLCTREGELRPRNMAVKVWKRIK